ncbi:bifunctional hydroxymethylpyrimidine kinase/phosphomethylpyrimidine kinase [Undibacterium pigrum]|uniref:bifunctional hydroxymethylpyrimidine kinase/phosphomethylpyrimidine kinase n=1 Tax=Undibacterium pigrum TaxID=401470 RepID=UPI000D75C9B3|nr:hydroxymethylpyrimidine/phosphomethylpyrimidine kinase [Undibacterium pigrum]
MQNQISPLILSFGASDPVAATGIHADLASFAAMGCYGLPVITAILTGDTSQIDDLHPLDGDLVDEQARTVLEDMPVLAFKVGQTGSVENVTVIAEIVSDYPELPLVLDPFNAALAEQGPEAEDLALAIRELLIPQASLLMISAVELSRLAETWKESSDAESESDAENSAGTGTEAEDLAADTMTLIESGCEYILVTGTAGETGEVVNTLYNESGIVRRDIWQRLPGSHAGAGSTLSAAIAALLANGLEIPEAVLEAQEFTHAALSHAQRLGMGRLIPDRYFWAKEAEHTQL